MKWTKMLFNPRGEQIQKINPDTANLAEGLAKDQAHSVRAEKNTIAASSRCPVAGLTV